MKTAPHKLLNAEHPLWVSIDNVRHKLEELGPMLQAYEAPIGLQRRHSNMVKLIEEVSDWAEETHGIDSNGT